MNVHQEILLRLLSCKMRQRAVAPSDTAGADWEAVFKLAAESKVDGLLYETVAALPVGSRPPEALLSTWKECTLLRALRQMRRDCEVTGLLREIEEKQLDYLIFKGPVLADLYETPALRPAVDIDLFVDSDTLPKLQKLLTSRNYTYDEEGSKQHVSNWRCAQALLLEVHTRLAEDYFDERSTALAGLNLTAPNSRLRLQTRLAQVTTMEHTNHLIYQVYHIAKHIRYRGILLRNFVDIAFFVNRYMDEIDTARFWHGMEVLRYSKLCQDMFVACAFYFGMNRRILPAGTPVEEEAARCFADNMLESGIYQENELFNAASGVIFQTAMKPQEKEGEADRKISKARMLLAYIFPGANSLAGRYGYARRFPILLPIAWVHRAAFSLLNRERGVKYMSQGYSQMKNRLDVLQAYGLLE